jgi:hypothetical protein
MSASIASTALRYQGVPYRFGGGNPGGWDCSGMIKWVLQHDLGLALPGGTYADTAHGPVVIQYVRWRGAVTVKAPGAAGDLAIWPGIGALGHIGIVLGPNKMISALNPKYGTAVTPIHGYGPPGVPVMYRRVTAAPGGGGFTTVSDPAGAGAGCITGLIALPFLPLWAGLVHFRRACDHHRGAELIGDDQDVILGELVKDFPDLPPVPPGRFGDVLEHLPVTGPPAHDDGCLPG